MMAQIDALDQDFNFTFEWFALRFPEALIVGNDVSSLQRHDLASEVDLGCAKVFCFSIIIDRIEIKV